jgi:hypothetical protein
MLSSYRKVRVSHLTAANHRSWRHRLESQRALVPKINVTGATGVAVHSHPINIHGVLFGIGENGLLPDHSLIRRCLSRIMTSVIRQNCQRTSFSNTQRLREPCCKRHRMPEGVLIATRTHGTYRLVLLFLSP